MVRSLYPSLLLLLLVLVIIACYFHRDSNASSNISTISDGKKSVHQNSSNTKYPNLQIQWEKVLATSRTTATLQVVANPILNTDTSPIASKLFGLLHDLNADLVRYVPWFPYPHYGVAELEPPNPQSQTTSWNFSNLRQQFDDTFVAVTGNHQKRLVINFSTQPTWMFNTSDWNSYGDNTNHADWHYAQGNWVPKTTDLVAHYYGRLASWIIHGSFVDEFGHEIKGGPAYGEAVTHWEIFNEPEGEHGLSWSEYNEMYDAIVEEIWHVTGPNHEITYVGLALEGHREWDWWRGFLTLDNHSPQGRDAVKNGYASFHWYGKPSSRTNVSTFREPFEQIGTFMVEVEQIIQIRDELSPSTSLAVNEAGVIPPDDNRMDAVPSPPIYYNMAAGVYTVLWCELSLRGVELVGSSQFCGCPAIPEWEIPDRQYPGVAMTNWTTGDGNPRYWALRMILNTFGSGDSIVESSYDADNNKNIYIQARITAKSRQKALIVVNKSEQTQFVVLPGFQGASVSMVDASTYDGPWKAFYLVDTKTLMLSPFAVAVVIVQDRFGNSTGLTLDKK